MNSKKILIVDDDIVTQKIISDILVAAKYQVAIVSDAASAVKAARYE
jgi:CheY-like chemotaxis protein